MIVGRLHASIRLIVVMRALAPRRVYHVNEVIPLRVLVNIRGNYRFDRLATHRSLVLAGGICLQRWQLMVRDCTGEVEKKSGFGS